MQSARLLPLRLSHRPPTSCQHLRRRAVGRTSSFLDTLATTRGAHTASHGGPILKAHNDEGLSGPVDDVDPQPHLAALDSNKPQHEESTSSPSLGDEEKLEEPLIAGGPTSSERGASPSRIRNHRTSSNHDVVANPNTRTKSQVKQWGSPRVIPESSSGKPNDDDGSAMSQETWGWRTNRSPPVNSLEKPVDGRSLSHQDQDPGELSESRLFYLGTAAMDQLRRLDKALPRPKGGSVDVTDGAWRNIFHEPDKAAGLPMNQYPRKIRQQVRALVELAARRSTANSSAAAKEAYGSSEPSGTGLSMSEIETRATERLRLLIRRSFKESKTQMSGELHPGPADGTKYSTLPSDVITRASNKIEAKLGTNRSLPSLITKITATVISEVRSRILQDLQSLGLSQEQPDARRNVGLQRPVDTPQPLLEEGQWGRDWWPNSQLASSESRSLSSGALEGGHEDSVSQRAGRSYTPLANVPTQTQSGDGHGWRDLTFVTQPSSGPTSTVTSTNTAYGLPSVASPDSESVPKSTDISAGQDPQVSPEQNLSLVEELFPEKPAQDDTSASDEVSVPRLQIEAAQAPKSRREQATGREQATNSTDTRRQRALKQHHAFEELGEEPTVLLLRNASTSLVEEDFRRLIPKGKHIQEWQGNGRFIKVIPGRNLETCERLNHYYIIFPSHASAQQYQRNAKKAHAAAQKHTQSSFLSAIPPPPGHQVNGEDVDALKKAFSLLPVSQDLQLNIMMPPYGPKLKLMMVSGELPRLAEIQHEHRVLLVVEGPRQHTTDIRRYIHGLGRDRGLAYELVEAEDDIKQLTMWKQVASKKHAAPEPGTEDADEPAHTQVQSEKEFSSQSWVISFVDGAEAKRFVRASHGRSFPVFSQSTMPQEWPSKLTAEYLW